MKQLDIVLGFSRGMEIFFVVQLFNFDFIISANINPDIRQIKAPQESQKKDLQLVYLLIVRNKFIYTRYV